MPADENTEEVNGQEGQETTPGGESDEGKAPGEGAPTTLKVGDEELSADQVQELVAAGKTLKQIKEQYPDIDLQGMIPAFTKQSQLLKDPDKLIEFLKQKFPDKLPSEPSSGGNQQPDQVKQVLTWMKEQGFITVKEAQESFRAWYREIREDEEYENRVQSLEKELNGKDGRPKFDRLVVLQHGKKKGIYDPKAAYNDLYGVELNEWYATQKMKKKPKGSGTEKGGAGIQLNKGDDKKLKFGSKELDTAMDKVLDESETD